MFLYRPLLNNAITFLNKNAKKVNDLAKPIDTVAEFKEF